MKELISSKKLTKIFKNITSTEVFVLIFAVMIFLFFYWTDTNRPGSIYKLGYYEIWYDQSQYYDMVISITKGNLGHFQYPIGYPALGVIGYLLYSTDPFLVINMLSFVLYTWLSYKINRKFFDEVISVISTLLLSLLVVSMFSTPWTSTVTSVCLLYIIYITLYEKYDLLSFVYSGLAVGLSFATRIGDVIPTSVALSFFIFEFMKKYRKINYNILLTIVIALALISTTIFINYTFSGLLLGNYMNSVLIQGFNMQAIIYKVYGYLFDSFTFGGEVHYLSMPLFKYCFLFILSPLGLYYLLLDKSNRKMAILILLSFLSWFITYVPHAAISGLTLKYGTLHYLKMLFPLLVILSLKYILQISTEKKRSEIARNMKLLFLYILTLSILLLSLVYLLNFSMIDMADAKVDASENNKTAMLAIDNDINTRWDTAKPQSKGMFYAVYFNRAYLINHIKLYTVPSPSGYPRDFNILCSTDGVSWKQVTSVINIAGTSNMDIYFDPLSCKSLKIVLTKDDNDWWSIHELRVYGR